MMKLTENIVVDQMKRPQVLLIGNGLEYDSGQKSWADLLKKLTVEDAIFCDEALYGRVPFPLLYQLITTARNSPEHLSSDDLLREEKQLKEAMGELINASNQYLDLVPQLDVDHVMTTNYSYCLEKAFFPNENFMIGGVRSKKRVYTQKKKNGKVDREREYRLHTYYQANSTNCSTGLWHIHGEMSVPKGIVLSHDRYGRLLHRIIDVCGKQSRKNVKKGVNYDKIESWPELILYGDVYILGLGLTPNEYDLWWLLRRKQREVHSQGRTVFYEREPAFGFVEDKHLLLQSCGVEICSAGCGDDTTYDEFYRRAMEDIKLRVQRARKSI